MSDLEEMMRERGLKVDHSTVFIKAENVTPMEEVTAAAAAARPLPAKTVDRTNI